MSTMPLSLVDLMVLGGVAVVLPLAIGGRRWWWIVATTATLGSFLAPTGRAGVLVGPLMAVTLVALGKHLEAAGPLMFWRLPDAAEVLACAYAVVAVGSLTQSRSGGDLFGIGEPIVELTAVHYVYAGAGALVLAAAAVRTATGAWQQIARTAVFLTAAAPPIVAVGFVTSAALPQVGGAVLMALGVFGTAVLHLRAATTASGHGPLVRLLLAVSGLAVWVPMVLAVAWAAAQHVGVPALSIPDMARTHGVAMALGFVICGLLGRRLSTNAAETRAVATGESAPTHGPSLSPAAGASTQPIEARVRPVIRVARPVDGTGTS